MIELSTVLSKRLTLFAASVVVLTVAALVVMTPTTTGSVPLVLAVIGSVPVATVDTAVVMLLPFPGKAVTVLVTLPDAVVVPGVVGLLVLLVVAFNDTRDQSSQLLLPQQTYFV